MGSMAKKIEQKKQGEESEAQAPKKASRHLG
jgi:hypothetical protein